MPTFLLILGIALALILILTLESKENIADSNGAKKEVIIKQANGEITTFFDYTDP